MTIRPGRTTARKAARSATLDAIGQRPRHPSPDYSRPLRQARRLNVAQLDIPCRFGSATERTFRHLLVVLALAGLVHSTLVARTACAADAPPLPPLVAEMRDRLLAAVASGQIDDLREPLEWNELPFMFRDESDGDSSADPIAYWKSISGDGTGRDILDDIGRMLALPPAKLAIGRDTENSAVHVWPYLSERPLDRLSLAEEKDLHTLMPTADAETMRAGRKWTWWRLVIGADGTWHALKKTGKP